MSKIYAFFGRKMSKIYAFFWEEKLLIKNIELGKKTHEVAFYIGVLLPQAEAVLGVQSHSGAVEAVAAISSGCDAWIGSS